MSASAPTVTRGEVVLRAEGVAKVYGGTHALRGVDFEVRAGEVTALIGENGAGKSTLMKILSGVEQASAGSIYLDDEPATFATSAEAVSQGVAIIHQELNLCHNMSISDNIFLARERGRLGFVDFREHQRRAWDLLERLEEPLDPNTLVSELRLGQQQLVEIAKALAEDARVLIMDEPTSALSHTEVEVLFRVMRELTARGVAIVYISHHLEECLEIADTGIVLRDGLVVASAAMKDVDLRWIVTNMVGREEADLYADLTHDPGDVILRIRDLTVADPDSPGRLAVDRVSLDLHEREIVGVFGLMGAGRTELLEALAGRNRIQAGVIELDGYNLTHDTVAQRIRRGLILVPEDRQRDGLVQALSVGANIALAALGSFVSRYVLSRPKERAAVAGISTQVRVKASSPDAPIGSLSGGNQQKAVIGKALLTEPRVLVLDEPTRGIDVGAKADIFALMAQQARQGRTVLFATSEAGEVLHACDRILIMARGSIVTELEPRGATREQLMALADTSAMTESRGNA